MQINLNNRTKEGLTKLLHQVKMSNLEFSYKEELIEKINKKLFPATERAKKMIDENAKVNEVNTID